MKKIFSKKLAVCFIGLTTSVVLLCRGFISEESFLILFLGSSLFYLFVEGSLDLSALKKIKAGSVEISGGNDDDQL